MSPDQATEKADTPSFGPDGDYDKPPNWPRGPKQKRG